MEMEHATFVPVEPERIARALSAPHVVAESMPGWQPDEPDEPQEAAQPQPQPGRLRLRVAGSTITYRGTLSVEGDAPPFVVQAQGEEVRGTGKALLRFEVTLEATAQPEPGTNVTYRGVAQADGRLAANDGAVVDAALRRLLDRFSAHLGENAPEAHPAPEGSEAPPAPGTSAEEPGTSAGEPETPAGEEEAAQAEEPDVVDDDGLEGGDLELVEVEVEVPESAAALDDLVSPAEAAHARRTMIGRSAEEVDHAPPRGRYAPEPAPDAASAAATLRWAAPAAAALLASAVVVGRVLRRRR